MNPTATIDNGQTGYAETGTWTTATGGFNGTNRVAKTTSGKKPTATASWTFTGLAKGSYDVYITYAGTSDYSNAAPFTVYDGSKSLATDTVNESILVTQSQGGMIPGSYGGVGWLELGTFSISSGTLEVLLSNLAKGGNSVDADGVLIVAHGATPMVQSAAPTRPGHREAAIAALDTSTNAVPAGPAASSNASQPAVVAGTSTAPAASAISITGISPPAPVQVVYNQGSQPVANQPSAPMVDVVLGLVGSQVEGRPARRDRPGRHLPGPVAPRRRRPGLRIPPRGDIPGETLPNSSPGPSPP